jgi:hypothetical protein
MMLTAVSVALTLAAADAPVATATATPGPIAEAEPAQPMPMHLSAGLTNSVGQGTFVTGSTNNPTVQSTLSLAPSFAWGAWAVSANQRAGIEWTQGDGVTYTNQLDLSDLALRVSYNGLRLDSLGLGLSLSGGYNVPISMASRAAGSLGAVAAGVRGAWTSSFGLGVSAGVAGNYNFLVPSLAARFTEQKVREADVGGSTGTVTPSLCVGLSTAELNSYGCNDGGIPSIAAWGPSVGVSYTLLDGALSFALDLGYRQSFSAYVVPEADQYTAEDAQVGWVPRQSMTSNLGVSWSPLSWFTLSGGLFTGGPFLSADGSRPRFPLWDFESSRQNLSSFFVDTTFSI